MKGSYRFSILAVAGVLAVLLAACSGSLPAGAELKVAADGKSAQVEFTGTVDSISAEQWVVSGQTVKVTSQTVIDGAPAAGDTVRVNASVTPDGVAVASKIEMAASSSMALAPVSGSGTFDDSGNEFTGVVQSMGMDSWMIGGQAFQVTTQTELKAGLSVGLAAKVHFAKNADGSMTATEIEPAEAAAGAGSDDSNSQNEFTGKVEAFSPESWTVSGRLIQVNAQTEIKDAIFLGDVVKVHFLTDSNGVLIAREIELAGNNQAHNAEKKLTGILEQISGSQATISGVVVLITPQTVLDSGLVIGQKVKAEVITGSDGAMTALEIETFNEANSTDDNSSSGGNGADDSNNSNSGSNSGSGVDDKGGSKGNDDPPDTDED